MKMIEALKTPKQVAHQYQICGLHLTSNVPFQLPKVHPHKHHEPDIKFTLKPPGTLPGKISHRGTHIGDIKNGAGQPTITVYKIDHGFLLDCNNSSTRIQFAMSRDGSWIECYPQAETFQEHIEMWLFGLVLSFLLQGRGIFSLHAAAVVCHGQVIAFLGNNGYGKTTLASFFLQKGHQLITDDVLPIVNKKEGFFVLPVCPSLNLWPETFAQLVKVNKCSSVQEMKEWKHRYPTEIFKVSFRKFKAPIGALYFLRPLGKRRAGKVKITPVPGVNALLELLRQTRASTMIALPEQKKLLQSYAQLVSQAPVRLLEYPRGLEFLPRIYDSIILDISREGALETH